MSIHLLNKVRLPFSILIKALPPLGLGIKIFALSPTLYSSLSVLTVNTLLPSFPLGDLPAQLGQSINTTFPQACPLSTSFTYTKYLPQDGRLTRSLKFAFPLDDEICSV